MDINKAFSADNGFLVDENNGGPFYTGGSASPIGLDLPTKTLYLQDTTAGVIVWRKYGTGVNDWFKASPMDFRYFKEDLTENSTSSDEFQTKLTETRFLPIGEYRLEWCFQGKESGANSIPEYQVMFNEVQAWLLSNPIDTSKYVIHGCFMYATVVTAGNITWELQYRNATNGRTTFIKDARMEIYRVG